MESRGTSQEDVSNTTVAAAEPDVDQMKYLELKANLKRMGLSSKGRKKELAERLRAANNKKQDDDDDEEDSEDDDTEDEESIIDEKETSARAMQMLSFKDVEESVNIFSGDGTTSVKCCYTRNLGQSSVKRV
ncbi:PREDICTED: nucleophosmin-like [Polistes dominula]|uniref:Nucleophosmin-like n=1 Tax=Polistes dominula TaxID=743375 RepID=A0ABM1J4Y9_POLDO|nr:PREDICTED: nucleophosmin-like [Polistes dominula]